MPVTGTWSAATPATCGSTSRIPAGPRRSTGTPFARQRWRRSSMRPISSGVDRDHELAADLVGDAPLPAVLDHRHPAGRAQPGLLRAGLVVDAGVDDAGVAPGLVPGDPVLLVEHDDGQRRLGLAQRPGGRQPDDARADDDGLVVHGRPSCLPVRRPAPFRPVAGGTWRGIVSTVRQIPRQTWSADRGPGTARPRKLLARNRRAVRRIPPVGAGPGGRGAGGLEGFWRGSSRSWTDRPAPCGAGPGGRGAGGLEGFWRGIVSVVRRIRARTRCRRLGGCVLPRVGTPGHGRWPS